jgi:hypothetical protein
MGTLKRFRPTIKGRVSRTEWQWVLGWALVALTLTNTPYLLGALLSTPEMRFGWAVYGVEDVNSYFAKMQQGARGAWLFHIPYTAEEHPGTIIYIHYLLLGKVAAVTGFPVELVYHVARLACGVLLLVVVYHFLARFTAHRSIRLIAFCLVVFSGGMGWLLTLVGRSQWLDSLPLDMISPESYVFLTLYSPPHIALATACLLWGMVRIRDGARAHCIRPVLVGMGAYLVAALIGAFYLLAAYAVLGVDWLVTAVRRRRPDWHALAWIVLSGIPTALVIGYDYLYFVFDPVYRVWAAQNLVPSLHPLHYVAGYVLVGAFALLGVRRALRGRWEQFQLPLLWLAIVPVLLYVPFSARRRLIVGAQVPLGLFAAMGMLYHVVLPFGRSRLVRWLSSHPRYSRAGMRRWLIALLVLATVPTNLLLVLGNCVEVAGRRTPIFHPRAELEALDWLRAHTEPDDTILCAYETGNYVPVRGGNRAFLGLGPETIYADRKRVEVERFFDAGEADAWREALLAQYGIAYVLVGPPERALGEFDADGAAYLEPVYANEDYAIYEVEVEP